MKRTRKSLNLLPLLLLLAIGLAGLSGLAPAQAGKAPGAAIPAQYEEEPEAAPATPGFRGALDIRIQSGHGKLHPPGELVLSSPSGETAGFDPRYNYSYREIPGGSYKREVVPGYPSTEAAVLYLQNAVSGTYSLRVIGTDYGQYRLSMQGYDRSMSHADLLFTIMIQPGEVHHYLINYSNVGGASLSARRTRTRE
jgi:hypothetical protein